MAQTSKHVSNQETIIKLFIQDLYQQLIKNVTTLTFVVNTDDNIFKQELLDLLSQITQNRDQYQKSIIQSESQDQIPDIDCRKSIFLIDKLGITSPEKVVEQQTQIQKLPQSQSQTQPQHISSSLSQHSISKQVSQKSFDGIKEFQNSAQESRNKDYDQIIHLLQNENNHQKDQIELLEQNQKLLLKKQHELQVGLQQKDKEIELFQTMKNSNLTQKQKVSKIQEEQIKKYEENIEKQQTSIKNLEITKKLQQEDLFKLNNEKNNVIQVFFESQIEFSKFARNNIQTETSFQFVNNLIEKVNQKFQDELQQMFTYQNNLEVESQNKTQRVKQLEIELKQIKEKYAELQYKLSMQITLNQKSQDQLTQMNLNLQDLSQQLLSLKDHYSKKEVEMERIHQQLITQLEQQSHQYIQDQSQKQKDFRLELFQLQVRLQKQVNDKKEIIDEQLTEITQLKNLIKQKQDQLQIQESQSNQIQSEYQVKFQEQNYIIQEMKLRKKVNIVSVSSQTDNNIQKSQKKQILKFDKKIYAIFDELEKESDSLNNLSFIQVVDRLKNKLNKIQVEYQGQDEKQTKKQTQQIEKQNPSIIKNNKQLNQQLEQQTIIAQYVRMIKELKEDHNQKQKLLNDKIQQLMKSNFDQEIKLKGNELKFEELKRSQLVEYQHQQNFIKKLKEEIKALDQKLYRKKKVIRNVRGRLGSVLNECQKVRLENEEQKNKINEKFGEIKRLQLQKLNQIQQNVYQKDVATIILLRQSQDNYENALREKQQELDKLQKQFNKARLIVNNNESFIQNFISSGKKDQHQLSDSMDQQRLQTEQSKRRTVPRSFLVQRYNSGRNLSQTYNVRPFSSSQQEGQFRSATQDSAKDKNISELKLGKERKRRGKQNGKIKLQTLIECQISAKYEI